MATNVDDNFGLWRVVNTKVFMVFMGIVFSGCLPPWLLLFVSKHLDLLWFLGLRVSATVAYSPLTPLLTIIFVHRTSSADCRAGIDSSYILHAHLSWR